MPPPGNKICASSYPEQLLGLHKFLKLAQSQIVLPNVYLNKISSSFERSI